MYTGYAVLHIRCQGTAPAETARLSLCHKAAEQGDDKAQYYLAKCYEEGKGVEKDLVKAVEWYAKAAEQGEKKTQFVGPKKSKVTKMVSPLQEGAFSESVIHQAVLNQIDFVLPDLIWKLINEAFEHFWDDEVGVGGYFDLDTMFHSIRNHLITAHFWRLSS